MQTSGTFFLRAKPYPAQTGTGEAVWLFPLLERDGAHQQPFLGTWKGPLASAFVAQHQDALKPGCALRMDIDRISARDNVLRCRLARCELAPARWPGRVATNDSPYHPQPTAA